MNAEDRRTFVMNCQAEADGQFAPPWHGNICQRLLAGLNDNNYGPENHLKATTSEWTEETKAELCDAYAQQTGLMMSRGEEIDTEFVDALVVLMHRLDERLQRQEARDE